MPSNTREFCSENGNDHAIISPKVELRDSLGFLAVHILAARKNLAVENLNLDETLCELYYIIAELHSQYDDTRSRLPDIP